MQQTRTHKAVTRRVEAKKLLSRRRQSEYSLTELGLGLGSGLGLVLGLGLELG